MSDETVELHPAHTWDCPVCGTANFARGIRVELTPDERAEMRKQFQLADGEDGNFLAAPEEVICSKCGDSFATRRDDDFSPDFDPHQQFGDNNDWP